MLKLEARGLVKLAYFVHDLTDPAVLRRVRMLIAGGAEPVVLGFRRAETAPETLAGAPVVDLGRTFDGRFAHRAKATAMAAAGAGRWRELLSGCEAIMARTLEMLAVAQAARRACRLDVPLTYECLDIHRLMLGEGAKSRAMRAIERNLMRRSQLLIVSSPAFLDAYFRPRQGVGSSVPIPTLLVENKVLELGGAHPARPSGPPPGRPWRIGWLGAIRCRRSLDILTELAARRPDLMQVSIHGRPAYTEFEDFDRQVAQAMNVTFGGAYTAADLPRLYGQAHFSWAIDYMEEGQNSAWLLPNRLYESPRFGAVPIALAGVQTGRYLAEHGFGVRLEDPSELERVLEAMSAEDYLALRRRVEAAPIADFVADEEDCVRLVAAIAGRGSQVADLPAPATAKLVA